MDRFRGFDTTFLRQQMEDLLEDFFPTGRRPQRPSGGGALPLPLNIVDAGDSLVVQAPLPGHRAEDVELSLRGQVLQIKVQNRETAPEGAESLRREWAGGPFQRSVELPVAVNAEGATASFRHGVVSITLTKTETAESRTIDVDDSSSEESQEAETEASAPYPVSSSHPEAHEEVVAANAEAEGEPVIPVDGELEVAEEPEPLTPQEEDVEEQAGTPEPVAAEDSILVSPQEEDVEEQSGAAHPVAEPHEEPHVFEPTEPVATEEPEAPNAEEEAPAPEEKSKRGRTPGIIHFDAAGSVINTDEDEQA